MKSLDRYLDNQSVSGDRILLHLAFWLFVWLIAPLTSEGELTQVWDAMLFRGVGMPVKIVATYLLVYYQFPRFLYTKKYLHFAASFLLSAWIFAVIYRYNNVHIAEVLAGVDQPRESFWEIVQDFQFTFFGYFFRVYLFSALFLMIKMTRDRSRELQKIEALQKDKVVAELNFLKAQIHPHFLFNTLNNLYSLTIQKSDQAPEVVAKLSEILDYLLYQCKEPQVPIAREIELIRNYISLESLRYGDRLDLQFDHELSNPHATIAPLILVSIVENAFKHGASGVMDAVEVKILLKEASGEVTFEVFNTKSPIAQRDETRFKEGIGSRNVRRQLELTYPERYRWEVNEESTSYQVILKITT